MGLILADIVDELIDQPLETENLTSWKKVL